MFRFVVTESGASLEAGQVVQVPRVDVFVNKDQEFRPASLRNVSGLSDFSYLPSSLASWL